MGRDLQVHLLPELCEPDSLRGGMVVILDILRASTTMIHALAAGAQSVIPCGSVDETRQRYQEFPIGTALMGGERRGLLIPGFHLDNNPLAYTPEVVRDRTILFTTSNGTRALLRARYAARILIGAFVNLSAVVGLLRQETRPIHLLCAGTEGQISGEDVLCAGAIAEGLTEPEPDPNDSLRMARDFYRQTQSRGTGLTAALRACLGGRNCVRLGFDDQIERAATYDLFADVPEYNAGRGTLNFCEPGL